MAVQMVTYINMLSKFSTIYIYCSADAEEMEEVNYNLVGRLILFIIGSTNICWAECLCMQVAP